MPRRRSSSPVSARPKLKAGYLIMLRSIARTDGLPRLIYHDRHTILRSPKEPALADELAGRRPQSQVQRVMRDLGIKSIPALAPPAKGRLERLWRTLQDRLGKELRLARRTCGKRLSCASWWIVCAPVGFQPSGCVIEDFIAWLKKFVEMEQHFVVRLQRDVTVHRPEGARLLKSLEMHEGERRDFGFVHLRADEFVRVRLIGVWTAGAKEVWWLALTWPTRSQK
jgi:hypothetical protein